MKLTERIAHAMKPRTVDRPKSGALLAPRKEDSARDYPGAGLTPSGLASILRETDAGSLGTIMQLFEEMEEKDAHLFAVANTRRLALTGLPWEIVSAADVHPSGDRGRADEAADYCREVLTAIDALDEVLQHLSLAIGRNISVAEIVWDVASGTIRPVDVVPVAFTRLAFDELSRLRILTEANPRDGIEPRRTSSSSTRRTVSPASRSAAGCFASPRWSTSQRTLP